MNKFYSKPKPETMKKNREEYKILYPSELAWLNDTNNFKNLRNYKNKFLLSIREVLTTGSRKMTPKMASSLREAIDRCKNDPRYSDDLKIEANLKIQPILEKILRTNLSEGLEYVRWFYRDEADMFCGYLDEDCGLRNGEIEKPRKFTGTYDDYINQIKYFGSQYKIISSS